MKSYLVTWQIELEALTHEDAANEARKAQTDPNSLATVFEVQEANDIGYGEARVIDTEQ